MEAFQSYLDQLKIPEQRARFEAIFQWIQDHYPDLTTEIKWNQPMFMDHGTFIIGFSIAKQHLSFTPEAEGMRVFSEEIKRVGYEQTKMLAKIKWTDEVHYELLKKMIDYNIVDKKDCTTFFRK